MVKGDRHRCRNLCNDVYKCPCNNGAWSSYDGIIRSRRHRREGEHLRGTSRFHSHPCNVLLTLKACLLSLSLHGDSQANIARHPQCFPTGPRERPQSFLTLLLVNEGDLQDENHLPSCPHSKELSSKSKRLEDSYSVLTKIICLYWFS